MINRWRGEVLVAVTAALVLLGCRDEVRTAFMTNGEISAKPTAVRRAGEPGNIVDSARAIDEDLKRFRAELGDETPPRQLGGERSRQALVRRFIAALEQGDSAALRDLALSKAEFAYLVYPESRYTRPPFRQNPALLWYLIQEGSEKGLRRALRRLSGQRLNYASHRCAPTPDTEGPSALWTGCVVRRATTPRDTTTQRLFGSIIERNGRFKFVSFANDL